MDVNSSALSLRYPCVNKEERPSMTKTVEPPHVAGSGDVPIVIYRDRFVFNKETGAFFTSSPEGVFILRAAWRGLTRKQIEAQVVAEFDISPAVAMSDTERFLLRLEEMRLLPHGKPLAQ